MEEIPEFYMDPDAARQGKLLLKSDDESVFVEMQGATREAIDYYVLTAHGKKVNFRAKQEITVGDDGSRSKRHIVISIGWPSLDGGTVGQISRRSELVAYIDYCIAALKAFGGNPFDESSWGRRAQVDLAPELASTLGE